MTTDWIDLPEVEAFFDFKQGFLGFLRRHLAEISAQQQISSQRSQDREMGMVLARIGGLRLR
jgi:hypothetical protein